MGTLKQLREQRASPLGAKTHGHWSNGSSLRNCVPIGESMGRALVPNH